MPGDALMCGMSRAFRGAGAEVTSGSSIARSTMTFAFPLVDVALVVRRIPLYERMSRTAVPLFATYIYCFSPPTRDSPRARDVARPRGARGELLYRI